jgi:flavin prenyltransferase
LNDKRRLIIGISGATGAIYGVRMLEILAKFEDIETHLVMSKAGRMTIQVETPFSVKDVEALADVVHDVNNVGASISSGSFRTEGMVIAPCSILVIWKRWQR